MIEWWCTIGAALTRRALRGRQLLSSVAALLALTLALVNPLICILHCALGEHIHDDDHGPSPHCFMLSAASLTTSTSSSVSAPHVAPRALYECIALAALVLAALVLRVRWCDGARRWLGAPRLRPPTPPPRLSLRPGTP